MYFLVLLLVVVVLFMWGMQQAENREVTECLKKQSLRRNGTLKSALFAFPQLLFRHQDAHVLVSAMPGRGGSHGHPPMTFAQVYVESFPDYRMRLRSKSTQTLMAQPIGLREMLVESPRFDGGFFIQGNHEAFVRSLLTEDIQQKLLELEVGQVVDVTFERVEIGEGRDMVVQPRLDVTIEKICTEDRDYERIIDTALLLYERLLSIREAPPEQQTITPVP